MMTLIMKMPETHCITNLSEHYKNKHLNFMEHNTTKNTNGSMPDKKFTGTGPTPIPQKDANPSMKKDGAVPSSMTKETVQK
jgi:hypothetical protein